MSNRWEHVNRNHVFKAIKKYDEEGIVAYSKNTFLIHNNILYLAKHIRAMAYEVAFGLPDIQQN